MKVIGVIPARYASTRFPGKPLALIAGKPLLQWVIEGAEKSKLIDKIIVATDDERILKLSKECGVDAVMTDPTLSSGTDRVWAALKDEQFDLALNIQGDEPLLTGEVLDTLIQSMIDNPNSDMATLGHPFANLEDMENPNVVKIVLNKNNEAIYFSRFPIPYSRKEIAPDINLQRLNLQRLNLQHIGLYGYKKSFLKTFCETPAQPIELGESLEQLRALYLGAKIQVSSVEYETRGVDTPEDVLIVEKKLLQKK